MSEDLHLADAERADDLPVVGRHPPPVLRKGAKLPHIRVGLTDRAVVRERAHMC